MKISLNIQMGQHLTMTPQLQQAIRLLQLSTLELQQEIQNYYIYIVNVYIYCKCTLGVLKTTFYQIDC